MQHLAAGLRSLHHHAACQCVGRLTTATEQIARARMSSTGAGCAALTETIAGELPGMYAGSSLPSAMPCNRGPKKAARLAASGSSEGLPAASRTCSRRCGHDRDGSCPAHATVLMAFSRARLL